MIFCDWADSGFGWLLRAGWQTKGWPWWSFHTTCTIFLRWPTGSLCCVWANESKFSKPERRPSKRWSMPSPQADFCVYPAWGSCKRIPGGVCCTAAKGPPCDQIVCSHKRCRSVLAKEASLPGPVTDKPTGQVRLFHRAAQPIRPAGRSLTCTIRFKAPRRAALRENFQSCEPFYPERREAAPSTRQGGFCRQTDYER